MSPERLLVMVPTYNEAENVAVITSGIRSLDIPLDILFVDDNSPDGTGRILDEIAAKDSRVNVLHRPGKMGIGTAHKDGIRWAYERGYKTLITMDSDLSHSPRDVYRLLEKFEAEDADVAVGSRFLSPGSLQDWVWNRKLMTHVGHWLTTIFLGLRPDSTNAFRCYRLTRIPRGLFEMVVSPGYSFFYESLHRLNVNGFRIAEIPINLPARTYGHSKMRLSDVMHSVRFLGELGWRTRTNRSSLFYFQSFSGNETGDPVQKDWDQYWSGVGHQGKRLYDFIAVFYRKFIIRPAVNKFVGKNFSPRAKLLHAGSGGGMVDVDMARRFDITAFDISPKALTEYARNHGCRAALLQGSLFDIPAEAGDYDGIFNLGVMEHFTEEEIVKILMEFRRVLKPGGRIVLFWPPRYGLATRALKFAHYVLRDILKKDIQLHPAEITHVVSRDQIQGYLSQAGFVLKEFYFGARDFFTHQIIVAEKASEIAPSVLSGARSQAVLAQTG